MAGRPAPPDRDSDAESGHPGAPDLARRLESSETRARQLLQAMPDAVVVTDGAGRIQEVNDQARTLFGYTSEELLGRPVELLVPPEARTVHRGHREQYTRTPSPEPMSTGSDIDAVTKDGRRVPVEINLGSIDLDGGPAVLATVRDVTAGRAMRQALADSRELLRGVMDGATEQGIIATDQELRVTLINTGAERLLGGCEAEMIGRGLADLIGPAHDPSDIRVAHGPPSGLGVLGPLVDAALARTPLTAELTLNDAGRRQVSVTLTAIGQDGEQDRGYVAVLIDIAARKAADRALRASEERFRAAFEDAPIGMAIVGLEPDGGRRLARVNRALCRLTGHDGAALIGQDVAALHHPDDAAGTAEGVERLRSGELDRWERECRFVRVGGGPLWVHLSASPLLDDAGRPVSLVVQVQDVTARRQAETELTRLALHDPLTGLPNRLLLIDHLEHALLRSRRSGTRVGVLFLDLDDFKVVNDSLGHETGDELLVEVARRLTAALRDSDTAARLGGDEFVVVCEDLHEPAEVEAVVARIQEALSPPVRLGGTSVSVSVSIGVAVGSGSATQDQLLRDADGAMYRAKGNGKSRYEVADTQLQLRALRQITLESELYEALDGGQLRLVYQPCVDLTTGAISGVEALLRWDHPRLGLLGPDSFLDVAEDRDVIAPLGAWVLRQACSDAMRWTAMRDAPLDVWVNVSSRQLGRHQLTATVAAALERSGLPAVRLGLELTERQIISAAHSVQADLHSLPDMGVRLAIDDFGTGNNGLDYLRAIPAAVLKIDKSYVAELGLDRTVSAITAGLVALGRSLDLGVVAEGVENEGQRERLIELGVSTAQGFLLGRPVPASEIDALLSPG